MNNKDIDTEETEQLKGCDTSAPMGMRYEPQPLPLQLAICQQKLQSTQRHKDALEGLAVEHHQQIERLTEQLYHERTNLEQCLDLARKEIEILRHQIESKAELLASWAEPQFWVGNIYNHPRPADAMPFRELLKSIADGMITSIPKSRWA